jgi:cytidylate kinase
LKDRANVLSVFIHADLEQRITRICEYENISRAKASDIIKKADKRRAGYCSQFADMKWGVATNYDLCINSAIGFGNAAQLIKFFSQHHK